MLVDDNIKMSEIIHYSLYNRHLISKVNHHLQFQTLMHTFNNQEKVCFCISVNVLNICASLLVTHCILGPWMDGYHVFFIP